MGLARCIGRRPARLVWFALVLAFALALPACADDAAKKVARYLASLTRAGEFSGVVLVADGDRIVLNVASGFADFRTHRPLKPNDVFNLASVSKQFTAAAIMILAEKGALTYDDDIRTFIPGFPYSGITVRHLLTHTSGLPEYFELVEEHGDTDVLVTNKDVVALLKQIHPKPAFKPGARHDYCNTGYALLASVIEAASGKTYAAFLRENIFVPLAMTSTFVYSPSAIAPFESRRAYGWVRDGRRWALDDMGSFDGVVGDGGLYSTTEDLFRWTRGILGHRLVGARTLKEAFRRGRLMNGKRFDYGFGWSITDDGVWHDGSWAGFRSMVSLSLSGGSTVIILSNASCENLEEVEEEVHAMLGSVSSP